MDEGDAAGDADEKIVTEAKKRFDKCKEWESAARALWVEDTRFVEGDSDNNYQWDTTVRAARLKQQRPCLTINKVRQHCLQIVNDARQNKAQIRINATGNGASYQSAKVFEGIARHIEYQSSAMETYESAAWSQVTGGWGYWRVVTDYVDEGASEQEIFIRRVRDPLSVYLDKDIQEFDGSDAKYGFAFRDMPRDEYKIEHPDFDRMDGGGAPLGETDDWNSEDYVREAEYFRKVVTHQDMVTLPGTTEPIRRETLERHAPDVWAKYGQDPRTIHRTTTDTKVEWFKIVGSRIVDRNVWPGRYIPLVRVVGEETIIQGQLDRKGHVRAIKDPQRMYNWQSSTMVEELAMQSKSPWVAPLRSVEGLETYWNSANIETRAYLPYNDIDEEGKPIAPPVRQPPRQVSAGTLEALKVAQNEMMMASGQYQSQFGENENAKSGVAIQTRQRQGDNATYHYIDHLAQAIKFTGRILIDLIPKIYDTPRVVKIMAEDGDQDEVHIDPSAPLPHQMVAPAAALGQPPTQSGNVPITPEQAKALQGDKDIAAQIKTIFNPKVGRYDVEADIGPAYATRRQETFNALTQIMGQNQNVAHAAMDLLFKAADFPMADVIAERIRRTIPPAILGEGPPPAVAQLQQQAEQMQQHMQQVITQLIQENAQLKMSGKDRAADNERRGLRGGNPPPRHRRRHRSGRHPPDHSAARVRGAADAHRAGDGGTRGGRSGDAGTPTCRAAATAPRRSVAVVHAQRPHAAAGRRRRPQPADPDAGAGRTLAIA